MLRLMLYPGGKFSSTVLSQNWQIYTNLNAYIFLRICHGGKLSLWWSPKSKSLHQSQYSDFSRSLLRREVQFVVKDDEEQNPKVHTNLNAETVSRSFSWRKLSLWSKVKNLNVYTTNLHLQIFPRSFFEERSWVCGEEWWSPKIYTNLNAKIYSRSEMLVFQDLFPGKKFSFWWRTVKSKNLRQSQCKDFSQIWNTRFFQDLFPGEKFSLWWRTVKSSLPNHTDWWPRRARTWWWWLRWRWWWWWWSRWWW